MNRRHVLMALALALGVTSSVGATQLNLGGANFVAYHGADVTKIEMLPDGVRSLSSSAMPIIASVDHSPSTTGETVYVDGCHTGVQTTTLTLYSFNYNDTFLGSFSASASSIPGCWERALTLTAAQSPRWAYLTLLATIPGNGNGRILGMIVLP